MIGAIADTVAGRPMPDRPPSASRTRGRRPGSQQLHSTFRSGSAAPTDSSLRSRRSVDGLRRPQERAGGRRAGGSVIGRPLHGGTRRRPYGRGHGYARGRARVEAPLSPARIAAFSILLCLVLVFATAIPLKSTAGIAPEDETPLLDIPLLSPTAFPVSTPVSEWAEGEMPHLYQTDAAWSTEPYGGGTVAANACGPTAMTMLYVYFTGSDLMDPGSMAAWADANNYAPTGATEWSYMTEGAAAFGFYAEMVDPTRSIVEGALQDGNPVVCVVGPGDFTNLGHYIILKSIDDRAMVEVYDPNSPENSARKWPLVRVLNQTEVAWVYSG